MDVGLLLLRTLANQQEQRREVLLRVHRIAAVDGLVGVALQLVLEEKEKSHRELRAGRPRGGGSSPGSGCLSAEWLLLQRPGTSVGSTAFCSGPGRRAEPGLPPHPARPHLGARRSRGAAEGSKKRGMIISPQEKEPRTVAYQR